MEPSDVPCPICGKVFPVKEIEQHASRCLFFNSNETTSPASSSSTKRASTVLESQPKRPKIEEGARFSEQTSDGGEHSKTKVASISSGIPLSEQLRPENLDEYVGQEHVLGSDKILRMLLDKHDIPSMILWGPPGCGKTTLAHVIAAQCKQMRQGTRFVKLSATMSGVNDVKEVVKIASNEQRNFKRRTILFMDEIHRFNKLQQDIFLPHVENGTIILIGATTENPSFSLNSALLSRCRVFVLEKLQSECMVIILKRALKALACRVVPGDNESTHSSDDEDDEDDKSDKKRWSIDRKSVQWLADMCDGDARNALNSLQMALKAKECEDGSSEENHISLDDIKDGIKRSHLLYDKKGDEHYNIISAMHKSLRASDANATLYWVTRMLEGGEDPVFVGRRLVRAASEDIGLADPSALPMAVATMQGCQLLGMPECDVLLAQCAVYLARAPKSTEVYKALMAAKSTVSHQKGPQPGVPLHLRNATSKLATQLGWGKNYNMRHKDISGLTYMPEGLENVNFFDKKKH
ncbi:ATPase WRNIP1 [Frankliniella occidentalis]|uniref:ATPase WRNIP1 n=1 Tax=Frankliniella occidentalis TaxID=133901 RepID=A0A6J1SZE8_FRAOC|nr:ATPase WRNIP1 [Frankliniella occidentalis]